MQNQTLLQAYELTVFAAQYLERLSRATVLVEQSPEERAWLETARARVSEATAATQQKLKSARALPELSALRNQAADEHLGLWVDALENLLQELTRELTSNSPLIEVLFPHQKFSSLRRGARGAQNYAAEFTSRATTSYVTRIAADVEYEFLPPLLARVLDECAKWREACDPPTIEPSDAERLRSEGLEAAARLEIALKQARALADAALCDTNGAFEELGLHAQPKRRAPRSEPRKSQAAE